MLSIILAGAAIAQSKCDLRDRSAMKPLSSTEFFMRPTGTLAIGEDCDAAAHTCARYFDITDCQKVDYSISESGSPGRINFSVNPIVRCDGSCDLHDSFLMAAFTFPHDAATEEETPFVALTRNKSDRWSRIGGGGLSQQNCCEGATSPANFLETHAPEVSTSDTFKRRTGMNWHSAFSLEGRGQVLTFEHRAFFVEALNACGDCSMKAFLLRFFEVKGGQTDTKPATPLFFSAQVLRFSQINVAVTVPFGDGVYDQEMVINIIR